MACVAFSADSQTLILGTTDGAVATWNLPLGKETRVMPAHRDRISSVALSADGKTFATGSWDTTALIWDATKVLRRQRSKPAGLTAQQREALWADLASPDAARAYRAMWDLVEEPQDGLPFVKERIKPVPKVEAARIAQWIESLENDKFSVREQATAELNLLGEVALPSLRKAMTGQVSLEGRRRMEKLLDTFGGPVPPPETLRALRAVEMLEHIGSPEARLLLHAFSLGAPEARVTQDAKASLKRLATRAPHRPDY
jgi:hypothetical protein